jgi:hypothetical protein
MPQIDIPQSCGQPGSDSLIVFQHRQRCIQRSGQALNIVLTLFGIEVIDFERN